MQLLRAARGSLASILMRRTALPLVCSSAFGILKPLARIAARRAARARLPARRSVRRASPLAGPRAHGFIAFQGCGADGLDVGGVGAGLHGDGDGRRHRAGLWRHGDDSIVLHAGLADGAGLRHAGVAGARAGLGDGAGFLAVVLFCMRSLSSRP